MKNKRKSVILVGISLFVLAGLFPPWNLLLAERTANGFRTAAKTEPLGYVFIAIPPFRDLARVYRVSEQDAMDV